MALAFVWFRTDPKHCRAIKTEVFFKTNSNKILVSVSVKIFLG